MELSWGGSSGGGRDSCVGGRNGREGLARKGEFVEFGGEVTFQGDGEAGGVGGRYGGCGRHVNASKQETLTDEDERLLFSTTSFHLGQNLAQR
jgi:hypothetical protein